MTVTLIRKVAKEIAGQFYEQADGNKYFGDDAERSARFRDAYPTIRDYMRGRARCREGFVPALSAHGVPVDDQYFTVPGSDRWWKRQPPGWLYFVEVARRRLVEMLNDPALSAHEKNEIAEALIKENQRATSPHAQSLLQRRIAGQVQVN